MMHACAAPLENPFVPLLRCAVFIVPSSLVCAAAGAACLKTAGADCAPVVFVVGEGNGGRAVCPKGVFPLPWPPG